jgi:hypothetical protein
MLILHTPLNVAASSLMTHAFVTNQVVNRLPDTSPILIHKCGINGSGVYHVSADFCFITWFTLAFDMLL